MRKCNICGRRFRLLAKNRHEIEKRPIGLNCLTQGTVSIEKAKVIEVEKQKNESDYIAHNTIIIPRGATNKDMFKVVFGYEPATNEVVCNKDDWCGGSEPCNYCTCNSDAIGGEEDWWNARYKAERNNNGEK